MHISKLQTNGWKQLWVNKQRNKDTHHDLFLLTKHIPLPLRLEQLRLNYGDKLHILPESTESASPARNPPPIVWSIRHSDGLVLLFFKTAWPKDRTKNPAVAMTFPVALNSCFETENSSIEKGRRANLLYKVKAKSVHA